MPKGDRLSCWEKAVLTLSISVTTKIMTPNPIFTKQTLTLYGIPFHKKKIIINKSVTEWELSKNETKNIFSLRTNLFNTTNTS